MYILQYFIGPGHVGEREIGNDERDDEGDNEGSRDDRDGGRHSSIL